MFAHLIKCCRPLWRTRGVLIPSPYINTTPEPFILKVRRPHLFRFFRRFPRINVGGDSVHFPFLEDAPVSPRVVLPPKGRLRQTSRLFLVLHLLSSRDARVRWHARVPYGYPHLLSTRGKRAHWHAETNVVICTLCQPEGSEPVDTQRLTSSSAPFVIQRWRVRWHAGVPYGYLHISVNPDPWSQVAGGDTQVVIHTNTTSVNTDPCVRWQAEIL